MYRRRRIVFGALVLLILGGLVGGVSAIAAALGGSSGPAPAAAADASAPSPAATQATAAPTPSSTPGCDQSKVVVTASTDAAVYKGRQDPVFSLTVANRGTKPCQVNLGTSQMEFLVTSGGDRVFSSKDCQDSSQDLIKVLAPGESETANFPWTRTRSLPGCERTTSSPGAGGATYVLVTKLGSRTSAKTVFQLG